MWPMARFAYPLALAAFLVVAAVWYFVLRSPVEVAAPSDPDVTIECAPSTNMLEEGCRVWGDQVLLLGAPSTTFELEDVVRIRLERAPFSGPCRAEYFLGRYPDEVTWTERVDCLSSD